MLTPLVVLAATLSIAQPQPAQDSSDDEAQTAREESVKVDSEDDENRIICRRTAITGSKFKKKLCGTKSEWDALQRRGSETTRRWQQRGKGVEPSGDPGI